MRIVRSIVFAFAFVIAMTNARAEETDPPITLIQPLQSAPKGADVFFGISRDLDLEKRITVVVYFHGLRPFESFEAMLERQRIAQQIADAQVNAVVVAPLMPYPIKKKHGVPFADKGAFKKFLNDASVVFAKTLNTSPKKFADARIVLIGYSAGHWPTKMVISHSHAVLDGVVLLDAHYGSQEIFFEYAIRVAKRRQGYFVTAHTETTQRRVREFENALREEKVPIEREPPQRLLPGMIVVIKVEGTFLHHNFVTSAWTENPITDLLKKAYGD